MMPSFSVCDTLIIFFIVVVYTSPQPQRERDTQQRERRGVMRALIQVGIARGSRNFCGSFCGEHDGPQRKYSSLREIYNMNTVI